MPPRAGIHEAKRRAQVLQAARSCIVAMGYERVTVRDIAIAAEVSTGTIVHYFGDKDSVLEAALLSKVQETGIAFRAALAGAASAWERLERLVDASLPANDDVRDEWRLWLTFWGEATRNERLRAVSERQHRRWTRFLARI
ncbi:MAG TPA: TetR family transcriptional regulator, partial [Ktedonobacterales bacterium]|nr:TetR family transcriptional regulator [Ktedonobacterales bacterium]